MGKFDNRDKMPGRGSVENNSNVNLSGKSVLKNRKVTRALPYFSDPLLVPRINQYLGENKDKVYIDINEMATELQSRYREYGRRKINVFRQAVQKAFTTVLQQCGLPANASGQDDEYVGSTDNSSSEVEECNVTGNQDKLAGSSNNQLINLYKSGQVSLTSKNAQKSAAENAELIDLSSDDENVKKAEKEDEKDAGEGSNNSSKQNYVPAKRNVITIIPKNSCKPEKIETVATLNRKRKLMNHTEKILACKSKLKRPSFQEPKVTFADFGGNTKALEEVCKLILHIEHPELYRRIGLTSPRGFLLHGPPGCGKTLLATAIAGELDVHFFKVSAPELIGGVSGESEERIRELFDNAVECSPCVLFIDEVDAITPNRQNAQREMERRIVAQLLTCLDELNNVPNGDQVLVIGATNRPDALDPALRRAGRFDREVCLGIPDLKGREQILRVVCKNLKMAPDFSYEEVAENTPGFVGADLLALTREAAMTAINRVFGALHRQEKEGTRRKNKKIKLEESVLRSKPRENASLAEPEKHTDDSIELDIIENDGKNDLNVADEKEKETGKEENVPAENSNDFATEKPNKESSKEPEKSGLDPGKDGVDVEMSDASPGAGTDPASKEIEICVDEGENSAGSEAESEVEILPEHCESSPPTLETLLSWLRETPPLTYNQLKNLHLTLQDFRQALRCVQPSAKREGFATVPDVTWDDIGSLSEIREELKMSILGPVKMRKQFEQLGLSAPAGILICGPPGCGKTLLAKAVANEAGINFISVKGPELLNMYVGESERAVRQCFQRARNSAPCVIFFDELDALCPKRSGSGENNATMRVVNQMLTEMDGIEDRKEVYLMAATNRPDIVDPAVLRPGRLDKVLFVGLPEAEDRVDILIAITKNGRRPKLAEDVDLVSIAHRPECSGYSGADLAALVREAGVQALKDLVANSNLDADCDVAISNEHFERALQVIRPSVSSQSRKHYEELRKQYCSTN